MSAAALLQTPQKNHGHDAYSFQQMDDSSAGASKAGTLSDRRHHVIPCPELAKMRKEFAPPTPITYAYLTSPRTGQNGNHLHVNILSFSLATQKARNSKGGQLFMWPNVIKSKSG